ncbi:MAG: extracellular solute-binding protein [Arachnia sp.]
MMKRTVIPAMVGVTALLLASCGGGGSSKPGESASAATGAITVWFSNNEQELAWGKSVTEQWNKDHADQMVTAQEIPAGASSEEAITAAITAGTAPCLVYNISAAAAPQWERQGGLIDLKTFADGEDYLSKRSGDLLNGYKGQDGGLFQVPWKSNPVMVMYNKDLFKKAGIDPEKPDMDTFDKFITASKTIVSSGAAKAAIWPSPTSEFFQPWFDFYPVYIAQSGGTNFVKDGKATFNDDNGKAVWEFFHTLYADGVSPKEKSNDDAMGTGTAAMQMAGPWAIASYKGKINYGFMPVPTKDGIAADKTYTFADSKNISMFTSCKATGTAWEFLKYTTSEENDGAFLKATGQMPIRPGLEKAYPDYFKENPDYVAFADQASRTVDVPNVANSVEMWQDFRNKYSASVIFGTTPIPDGLAAAEKSVNDLISK